jgi:hypothetical protein
MLQQFDCIFDNLYNIAKNNKTNLDFLYNDFLFDNIIISDDKWNKYKFLFKHSPLHMIINTKEKFNIFDISYIFETSPNLISLIFNQDFNLDLNDILFPNSLLTIIFIGQVTHDLSKINFPNSIISLIFDSDCIQMLSKITFPISLQTLKLGHCNFNDIIFPSSLITLELTLFTRFKKSVDNIQFPSSLKYLKLTTCKEFNQNISDFIFPSNLIILELSKQIVELSQQIELKDIKFTSNEFPISLSILKFNGTILFTKII